MKTIFPFRRVILPCLIIFSIVLLSSCTTETIELLSPETIAALPTRDIETNHSNENSPDNQRRAYGSITFNPQKGKLEQEGVIAEFIPHDNHIILISEYRIRPLYHTVQIVEAPDCGRVTHIQSCFFHYTITVDDDFVNCLDNTNNNIHVGYWY